MNLLYVAAAWLPRRETITVGALGPITFARGWYAYVGSARRGRDARLARHMRAAKPLRWHADYLFARHPATRAWLIDTELTECELAAVLRAALPGAERRSGRARAAAADARPERQATADVRSGLAGFGAGDCGCAGHLVAVGRFADLDRVVGGLARPGATVVRCGLSDLGCAT